MQILDRLLHDVDAVEVADNDRFEDEVAVAGVLFDLGQHFAEVAQRLRAVGALRAFQVIEKASHGLEAGGVERLENVEGGEEEGAGAAGGIENGYGVEGFPEGAHQFRPFAVGDHIQGELFDVEIVGDEVVDRCDLAGRECGVDFLVATTAGDVLAPGLGGQGVCVGGRVVPAAAPGDIIQAGGDGGRQRLFGRPVPCPRECRR